MTEAIFDKVAADYDDWYVTEIGNVADQVERALAQRMFQPSGSHVLEVGCGTGQHTVWLVQAGYDLTAVDISGEMMAKARTRIAGVGGRVQWWQADIAEILDQLGKFYGIFSMTAFEFVPQPEQVLARLYECLEPGGCLLIGMIAGESPWSETYQEAARQNPASVFAHAKLYTEQEIRRWRVGGRLELGRALFFPPSVATAAEALALEEKATDVAGFLVAKWVKA
ncbi:class I SAM-dependent methyltransferase [Alicyclobacillaceae bacterium I2511]|nr:class I SAM-dependent methyltransferase [Alicyclobacillaceae bacterium I2511]